MLKPTKEAFERINDLYATFAEFSEEVNKTIQELKPLADMESLDEDTARLIEYVDQLEQDFTSAFLATEELTHLLENQE